MRNKKGQFIKGNIPWCKGTKGLVIGWNKDKKMSQGYKDKCSETSKKLWQNPEFRKNQIEKHKELVGEKSANWQGGKKKKICIVCGKEFEIYRYRKDTAMFCSRSCQAKSRTGKDSANWKNGLSSLDKKIRSGEQYNEWRNVVYKRDNWSCQRCFRKQKHPIAHHIESFKDNQELRFDINNGITLCRSCHKMIHKEIGLRTRFIPKLKVLIA